MSVFVARSSVISLCMAAGISVAAADADTPPARVVSMNLCTDQLAMMLADRGQLVSISAISLDENMSPMAEQAARYAINHGGAEEIFLMQPDLVVAGRFTDPVAIAMLRRLGIAVVQFDIVSDLSQVSARLAQMGDILGQEARAQRIIADFEADLLALSPSVTTAAAPRAAFAYPNSWALGTESLSHEVLTAAGFAHIAAELGQDHGGRLDMEVLIMSAPDLLIHAERYGASSRAEEVMTHPALAALGAKRTQSSSEWVCGTPVILNAIRDLRAVHQEMAP